MNDWYYICKNFHREAQPHRRWLTSVLGALLRLSVGVTLCFVAGRCGAALEARREQAIDHTHLLPDPWIRGRDLWLRCPGNTTWYNYTSERKEH